MRIGVDAACLANGRGYGRFTRELLRAMVKLAPDDEFVLFLDERAGASVQGADNVRQVMVRQSVSPTRAASADGYRSPIDMIRFTAALWRERPDVFFSPSVYTYFPVPPAMPTVVSIHDAIAERFPELTLPSRRARLFWRMKVGLALKQADLVLTVSDFASRELQAVLNVPAARIRVAVEAPSETYRPSESPAEIAAAVARLGLPPDARWLVYVGGFNPHKRVDRIARAHARLRQARPDEPIFLLLVGTTSSDVFHDEVTRIRATIAELGTGDFVRWTGFLPDDELRHIHSGAIALVLPSESEGFGLPAVEAAACGTPVVATTASPLPELLEGGGIFIPPGDEAAMTEALLRLAADAALRSRLGSTARLRAAALCWETSGAAALGALREVIA